MENQTPFEKATETAHNLATCLALHKALLEIASAEGKADPADLELQKEILVQALFTLSPIVGEA